MVENNDLQGFFDSMLAPDDAAPSPHDQVAMPSPIGNGTTEATIADEAVAAAERAPAAVISTAAQPAAATVATAVPPRPSSPTRPAASAGLGGQRSEPPRGIPVQVPAPMPEEPNPSAEPPREWVVFNLGAQTYALDVNLVREIVRPPQMEPMPHAPDTLVGMANLRGIVVPVFDIAKLLGWQPEARDGLARVIVIEHDDDLLGLMVDAVQEILRFDGAKVEPPPSVGAITQHVVALLRRPNSLVQLLDPSTLFAQNA